MDESEDPLSKISHQLSELAAVPTASDPPPGASADLSGQWTQFSGINPQSGQEPFRNICSWNPMDLPDFQPLSQLQGTVPESSPNCFNSDSEMFTGRSDFLSQRQFSWPRGSFTNQNFQVTGDLSGRLVDMPRSRVHSCGFDHSQKSQDNFQSPNHVFQFSHIGSCSNVPLHRQTSQPLIQNPVAGLDKADVGTFTSTSGLEFNDDYCADKMRVSHGVSPQALPSVHSIQPLLGFEHRAAAPPFEMSGPPPLYPSEKPNPEKFQQKPGSFSRASDDDLIGYLQAREKINVNLDLGISIDKTDQPPFSNKGCAWQRQYKSKKHWHSFDSCGMPASDNTIPFHTLPQQTKLIESSGCRELPKPSYSDIAKIPKNCPVVGKVDQCNTEGSIKNNGVRALKTDEKSFQSSTKKTSCSSKMWQKSPLRGEFEQPRVSPTSRYGLDIFHEQMARPGSHSSSSESLNHIMRSRTGSGSSAGSSVSAPDDVVSQEPPGHILFSENSAPGQRQSPVHKQHLQSMNSAKPSSTKPTVSSAQSASKESLFFDPRRIFQCKNTNRHQVQAQTSNAGKPKIATSGVTDELRTSSATSTVLNNDKPATRSSKLLNSAQQHGYINNDLRDASKLTNQIAAESIHGHGESSESHHKQRGSRARRKSGEQTNGTHLHCERKNPDGDNMVPESVNLSFHGHHIKEPGIWSDVNRDKLVKWSRIMREKLFHFAGCLFSGLLKLLIFILFLVYGAIHVSLILCGKSWLFIKGRVFSSHGKSWEESSSWKPHESLRKRVGLEENINLPATGDEAMKRLLACKGKDPYSILGLRSDSTDEDIKKYYRKQAVLVHPDKNQEPGAEEAFKILGHAFEMIGEPAKRRQYDSHAQETDEAEAMREFGELLRNLQTKIQEAMNTMRCDNCEGKHRRVPVDRPFYSARFCQACNTRHSAKEGDVWAESTKLGFYWQYFALMEGQVFNITEWMKCHKEYFSRMEANSHAVMYRITTDGRRSRHHQPGDANLEELLNRILNKSNPAADGQKPWASTHPGPENRWGQGGASAASASTAAASAGKRNRRKKKRN